MSEATKEDIDVLARAIHNEWPDASDWYELTHRNVEMFRAMARAAFETMYDPDGLGLVPLAEVKRLQAVERAARYLRNSDAWVGDSDGIEANLAMLDEALNPHHQPKASEAETPP